MQIQDDIYDSSAVLWRNVWSRTGSAKHAKGTYEHAQFITPFLSSLYMKLQILFVQKQLVCFCCHSSITQQSLTWHLTSLIGPLQ